MTIRILPARLANQIAAGEVVERPASVVKELVENSLDSGATKIDIDIEKGGAKLIRIRDNGSGIVKDELGLALSRHATSKIHTLDDLEAIMSLGFRGEALASISSVARLTLTSRPATQEQAWSAYTEGRDMQVKLQPTAHPIGTTVEVVDLFFNTPARRKFLRTEKTEFAHIDELLKRIALSRFDVSITLRHNGKVIRQYRAAHNDLQAEKRLATVCGQAFVRCMLKIELEHQGLKLHGWITTPEGARQQSDLQYCYVNGRMMRDKLINHAIRQSYETSLKPEQFAAYVLFIELDPHQVDVNVHPAKHEVRFHQARLVHDFIYQALASALAQSDSIEQPQINESAFHYQVEPEVEPLGRFPAESNEVPQSVYHAIEKAPAYPRKAGQEQPLQQRAPLESSLSSEQGCEVSPAPHNERHAWMESRSPARHTSPSNQSERYGEPAPSKHQVKAYAELLHTPDFPSQNVECDPSPPIASPVQELGKAVSVVAQRYLLTTTKAGCQLVSLARAEFYRTLGQLNGDKAPLKSQPLLVPLSLKLEKGLVHAAQEHQDRFARMGILLKMRNEKALMVMGVPAPLRQQNLQLLIPDLLSYAASQAQKEEQAQNDTAMAQWLALRVAKVKSHYTLSEAIQIISELEQLWQEKLPLQDAQLVTSVDFSATIAQLT
ncbi:DNA mismatch repair endonuclease MutL [Vibrio vulnificus]|uniref:DNA mismatch repair endonuclease MutL n=1 Tax=Vibrio vulnificus TaxID=672 RepID=UPI000C7A19C5|nr:DNA mismatch repair endonuclease MutL [Vibrio vulnificus]EGR0208125.1 DNA mismatch repair endonuclease MutL [Vibrio vulnificus]EHH0804402.1 DNA mismatch repair endonuclease MutL [Vibrio vulnificus]EHI9274178.1 DNA mismatch repair endonuclease MutL [Vibrio vulnificus]EHK9000312.1 DNA mismatch repair endonuclease MutL [Vibrio vulnificus]EIX4883824.1 DNA mismatch repair endonuclease MutL [Vibrio vulnificus]